jgi:hypothetical protein
MRASAQIRRSNARRRKRVKGEMAALFGLGAIGVFTCEATQLSLRHYEPPFSRSLRHGIPDISGGNSSDAAAKAR